MEEEIIESNPDDDSQDQSEELTPEEEEERNQFLAMVRANMQEEYQSREFYADEINQAEKRSVNWQLLITQIFSRYTRTELCIFGIGFGIVLLLQILIFCDQPEYDLIVFMSIPATLLFISFIYVTIQKIRLALTDIRRMKREFCTLGFLVKVNKTKRSGFIDDTDVDVMTIAYKDKANMIHTVDIATDKLDVFTQIPAMLLFVEDNDPKKITFVENMPHGIRYDVETQRFLQELKACLWALVPVMATLLYIAILILSYVAYLIYTAA